MRRSIFSLGIAVLALLTLSRVAFCETWAERLGFPPDKKVLILHAHDMGMCFESGEAGRMLLEAGLVRSASVMATCPWFGHFAAWASDHPQYDVGLQLTLNSELAHYRWPSVAPDHMATSLLDVDGYLWRSPMQTMVSARPEDVESELRAQIERARTAGIRPTHFTSHLGTLYMRQDLAELYLRLAREYWIPAVVVELTPDRLAQFRQLGYPLPDTLIALMEDYPFPKVDDLRIVPSGATFEQKREAFVSMIDQLPPGLTQVAFAPAVASDALPHMAADWQQRVWEAQLFEDETVKSRLAGDDVVLTNWAEIMRRFEGAAAAGTDSSD